MTMTDNWYKIEKCPVHDCWKVITYDDNDNKKLMCFRCRLEYYVIQTKNK